MNNTDPDPIFPNFKPRDSQNNSFWNPESRSMNNVFSIQPNETPFLQHTPFYNKPETRNDVFNNSSISYTAMNTPPQDFSKKHRSSSSVSRIPDDYLGDQFTIELDENVEDVVAGLKLQVETLITAIMMCTPDNGIASSASTALQGADAIEVSHRIMTRLKLLREENQRLGQLSTGVLAAKLEAQNAELKEENKVLREQLQQIQMRRKIIGSNQ